MVMLIKSVTATPTVVSFAGYPALYLLVAAAVPVSAIPTRNTKIMIYIPFIFSFIVYYYRPIRIHLKI